MTSSMTSSFPKMCVVVYTLRSKYVLSFKSVQALTLEMIVFSFSDLVYVFRGDVVMTSYIIFCECPWAKKHLMHWNHVHISNQFGSRAHNSMLLTSTSGFDRKERSNGVTLCTTFVKHFKSFHMLQRSCM